MIAKRATPTTPVRKTPDQKDEMNIMDANTPQNQNLPRRGFTLVELMVTVAIIAVLASVAIMGFTKWIKVAKESRAKTFLALVKTKQENYRNRFGSYVDAPSNPSVQPTDDEMQSWNAAEPAWRLLGADPGANRVAWQYRTAGNDGSIACSNPNVGGRSPDVCAGFSPGEPWFWAWAFNGETLFLASSKRAHVWKVEE